MKLTPSQEQEVAQERRRADLWVRLFCLFGAATTITILIAWVVGCRLETLGVAR